MGDSHQRQGHQILFEDLRITITRFVPGHASIVAPPSLMLTKDDILWHWDPLQNTGLLQI